MQARIDVDIRGTDEARDRARALPEAFLARVPPEVLEEEMGVAS